MSVALAAALKPFIWPVLSLVGLLLVRWAAIVVYRLLPAGKLRAILFDKHLLESRRWIWPTIAVAGIGGMLWYASTFH